ncbi:MAG TPA: DUF4038 domain-containing protein [Tepidisphaeraceae bacterium]|nr:DUF4038 domain-containing protein [Tepidisphaeraceae bacterium]
MSDATADRFERHGPVCVSASGTHLAHADGTPFFYLADTAWNGGLLSTDAEWAEYLAYRAAQGFTTIQLVAHAPWTAALADAEGHVAFDEQGRANPAFFDRMDRKLAAINAHGMLAVPVLAWAANFGKSRRLNMGHTAPYNFLSLMIAQMVARFASRQVMWVLAGDGKYDWWRAWKWKSVGRTVFGPEHVIRIRKLVGKLSKGRPPSAALESFAAGLEAAFGPNRAPVAMHPMGGTWPYKRFEKEAWLDVLGYQSSHSERPDALRWFQHGPPATYWRKRAVRARPVINLEPVYEGIAPGYAKPFGRDSVRRAVWWSLLNAPTAGVAYGAHGLWGWHDRPMEALNHTGLGEGPAWREAMKFPGAEDLARVAAFMETIEWWRLTPDDKLVEQPFPGDATGQVPAARSPEGDLAVAYVPRRPEKGVLRVDVSRLAPGARAEWFDPRTGERVEARGAEGKYEVPEGGDWVWVARS